MKITNNRERVNIINGDIVSYEDRLCYVVYDENDDKFPVKLIDLEYATIAESFKDYEVMRTLVQLICKYKDIEIKLN